MACIILRNKEDKYRLVENSSPESFGTIYRNNSVAESLRTGIKIICVAKHREINRREEEKGTTGYRETRD